MRRYSEGREGGFQLAGGDAQELVGSMISDYNLKAKNVEDKLSATRGTRKQFLASRLRERSTNINNRNRGLKGNRVVPVPEDGDGGGGGSPSSPRGGGGSPSSPRGGSGSPSSPRGGSGGGWFGVMSGSPTGGGAAASPSGGGAAVASSGGGAAGRDANGGDHVVDIQR